MTSMSIKLVELEIAETYAICWKDDPKVRIVRYRGDRNGFLIFTDPDGITYHCRYDSIIIRQCQTD